MKQVMTSEMEEKETQIAKDRKLLAIILKWTKETKRNLSPKGINWNEIARFLKGDATPVDCQTRFMELIAKVPKRRTTTEIASHALQLVDFPKKPLTPKELFEKKFRKKHTDLDDKEFVEKCKDKWKNLAEKKRVKLQHKSVELLEEYETRLLQWKEEHQDFLPTAFHDGFLHDSKKKKVAPPKKGRKSVRYNVKSAYSYFVDDKKAHFETKYTDLNSEQINEKLQKKWNKLKDSKKGKYQKRVEESLLSSGRKLNGYLIFYLTRKPVANPGQSVIEQSRNFAKLWAELDPKEKERFNMLAKRTGLPSSTEKNKNDGGSYDECEHHENNEIKDLQDTTMEWETDKLEKLDETIPGGSQDDNFHISDDIEGNES